MATNILFYFLKWRQLVTFEKYDRWCEENHDYLSKQVRKNDNNNYTKFFAKLSEN
jgi:hypothetical protein